MASVIHRDAAAGERVLAPPVGAPFGNAARVRRAKRLQGGEAHGPDDVLAQDGPHLFDHGSVPIVVAGKKHPLFLGADGHRRGLARTDGEGLFTKDVKPSASAARPLRRGHKEAW